MANVQKRPNGKWRARYRDEAGKEHARHFELKWQAKDWLDEVTASVVTGTYVDPKAGKVTFDDWFDRWVKSQIWVEGTVTSATQAGESVTFGTVPINKVREEHVQAWIKGMVQGTSSRPKGLAASTIRTRFNFVHMAFLAAQRRGLISKDPCIDVKLPRKPKVEASMTIPRPEDVARALRKAPDPFEAFVAVCAFAGLRLGEAAGLQKGDVDFLRRTITVARQVQGTNKSTTKIVDPKSGSGRTVPIPDELAVILSEHIANVGTWGDEDWLFADGLGGLMTRSSAGHQWRRLRAKIGLDAFTLHDLRHFYASGLIASGCDVVVVQKALGHSSPAVTLNVYSHLWSDAEDRTRAAATALAKSVLGSPADSVRTADAD